MLRPRLAPTTVAALALALAWPGAANGVDTRIVLAATDDGCPGDRAACFQALEGELSHIEGGHGVQIVLTTRGIGSTPST